MEYSSMYRLFLKSLVRHKDVSLPEIGRFKLEYQSAFFETGSLTLHPPAERVDFHRITDETATFSEHLLHLGFDQAQAQSIQSELCQTILQQLKTVGQMTLLHIGDLRHTNEGITCAIDPSQPLNHLQHFQPVVVKPKKYAQVPQSSNDKPVYYPYDRLSSDNQRPLIHYLWPILIVGIVGLFILIKSITYVNPQKKSPVIPTTHITQDTLHQEDTTVINQIYEQNNDNMGETSTDTSPRCTLILGSFVEEINADKLYQALEKQGFQVFKEDTSIYHRVGIIIDIDPDQRVEYLQSLRRQGFKDAWYLTPALFVPPTNH